MASMLRDSRGRALLRLAGAAAIALLAVVAAAREPRTGDAAFHLALIDEVQFGRGGDPDLQFVEIRMLAGGQNITANSRLSAWNADGSFFGIILTVPSNVTNASAGGRWIMASTGFAAASGMTPDFTFAPVTLPATGMICWGAPGLVPPNPPTWDATLPTNYIDCVPYNGYANANIRFGPASPFGLGDGTNSLTRISDTDNTSVDFALACPSPRNAANGFGYNHDAEWIDLPPSKAFDDVTRVNSDTIGDDCGDTDDDNDGLSDADELGLPSGACPPALAPTNPFAVDSDGDRAADRFECLIGSDPNNAASVPPVVPDTDNDRLPDALEPTYGTTVGVTDTDGDGVIDGFEARHYASDPTSGNTDSDVCGDAREIASINADLTVSAIDLSQVAQSFGNSSNPNYLVQFDMNKDGNISAIDLSFVAQRFGPCP